MDHIQEIEKDLQVAYKVVKELRLSDNVKDKVINEISMLLIKAKDINLFDEGDLK